jgi:hypothetical protein
MGTYAQGAQTAGAGPQAGRDVGYALFSKTVPCQAVAQASVDFTTYLPDGAQIVDIILDTVTAHTSASAAILIGTSAAGGTELVSSTTVTAGGRVRPTLTAAQLTAMNALARNSGQLDEAIYVRLNLGAAQTAVGLTNVTFVYSLKIN